MKMNLKKGLHSYTMAVASLISAIFIAACDKGGGGGGDASNKSAVDAITSAGNVVAVSAGKYSTLVIKNDGTVWAFGSNTTGELGLGGKFTYISKPQQITSLGIDASAVIAGHGFSLVLKTDGTLWSLGKNDSGQLGLGNKDNTSTPTKLTSLGNDVSSMTSGYDHTLIIKKNGSLWTFGDNVAGQLGLGNYDSTSTAKPAIGDVTNGVLAVVAGYKNSFALKNDGTVWAFGVNNIGQLGLISADITTAQQVKDLSNNVQAIATNLDSSLVLKTDGTVWAFGRNAEGQLGLGNIDNTNKPTQIIGDVSKDVQAIATGWYFSFVLKKDGTLWAMGLNTNGQLGFGNNDSTNTAKQVVALGNSVQSISAGSNYSMVIKKDGTLWSFGKGLTGQLGIGDVTNTSTPTRVIIP